MPTGRAYVLLTTSFLLYLFANQTQVGWLYVMSALLVGIVLMAWWMNRHMLPKLQGERRIGDEAAIPDLYEGDETVIELLLRNQAVYGAYQLRVADLCPLAAPEMQHFNTYASIVPGKGRVTLSYKVTCDRRGLHIFPPVRVSTRAPFGFFHRTRKIDAAIQALVYPEVRPLELVRLLAQQPIPARAYARSGLGSEVIGVRPFRTSDSPRHIHWRAVARTRELATKEFAEESQAGLTIVLDLHRHGANLGTGKYTTFERAIKIAASLGDYAQRRALPVEIVAECADWPAPRGALSRFALMQYLARVQADGATRLAPVLAQLRTATTVAVLLPWPDVEVVPSLVGMLRAGVGLLVMVIDPSDFPAMNGRYKTQANDLVDALVTAGVDTRTIGWETDWVEALERYE